MTDIATIEAVTSNLLLQKINALCAEERALLARIIALENGGSKSSVRVSDADRRLHERLQARLADAGVALPDLPEHESVADLHKALSLVRNAIERYGRDHVRQVAVEATAKALSYKSEWFALQKEWLLKALAWVAVEERAYAFRGSVGNLVSQDLPPAQGVIGCGAYIHLNPWTNLGEQLGLAIEAGVLTHAEIDRARRGKGGS